MHIASVPISLRYFSYVILTLEVTITIQTRVKMYHLVSDIEVFVDLTRVVTLVTCMVTDTRLHCLATIILKHIAKCTEYVYERKKRLCFIAGGS